MKFSTGIVRGLIGRSKDKLDVLRKNNPNEEVPRPRDLLKSIDYLLKVNQ